MHVVTSASQEIPPLQKPETQQSLPQQAVLVQPQLRGRSGRPQPREQGPVRQGAQGGFSAQQAPW